MDNPFFTIDQRLEGIENSLRLILESHKEIIVARQQSAPSEDQKFTARELSKYLGVDITTVHRYKNNGVLPCYRAGRTILFNKPEVDAAMSSLSPRSKKGGSTK
jgi:excisionase family DNA binding protein